MNILVPKVLKEIEHEYDVEILWAVESGSRAWGLESEDSDFDVRFIYRHKRDFYLRLDKTRDVIERPIDDIWDVSGWDLDKTLGLLYKSNPTLFEWFKSPIVYKQTDFTNQIQPLLKEYFSSKKMLYHYLSMAKNNYKVHLTGLTVQPKKYFYVLRALLACKWIIQHNEAPPITFAELQQAMLPLDLHDIVNELIVLKRDTKEKDIIQPIPELQDFIESQIRDIDSYLANLNQYDAKSWDELNNFFLSQI